MPLRALHISKCVPGLVLGRAVVDEAGGIIAAQHAALTAESIAVLEDGGHRQVIIDADAAFTQQQEYVEPEWIARGVEALTRRGVPPPERMPAVVRQARGDLDVASRAPSVAALFANRENVKRFVHQLVASEFKPKVLSALVEIKTNDPTAYIHGLSTAIAATMIGRAIGLPQHRMQQLIAGCLLQDLGAIYLPPSLTAKERLHYHPLLGFQLLRKTGSIDALSAHVALEHHEFTDGSGEPRGVIGQNSLHAARWALPPLATLVGEIAAVANFYAFKSVRGPDGGLSPDQAIKAMAAAAGRLLNKAVVGAFLQSVPIYPSGARVIMRGGPMDGFRGRVSAVNPVNLDQPVVTLERDRQNTEIEPTNVDLSREKAARIEVRAW